MSTMTLEQPMSGPVFQGSAPISIPLPRPDSSLYLPINASGVRYELELPIVGNPIIEDNKIEARFIVDDNVYLDLNLIGQRIKAENKFIGWFSLFYQIEQRRPRAHFVADNLMAIIGLAGSVDLKIFELGMSTNLNFDFPLLEISKMLCRRQVAYRLMVIEKATGKEFLLPPTISAGESSTINFVYHAIVDRSFTWGSGRIEGVIPAIQQWLNLPIQPFNFPPIEKLVKETIFEQPINLGPAKIIIEDAVVLHSDKVRRELAKLDGQLVDITVESLSGQVRYEFMAAPQLPANPWEENIQRLIDLEDQLDSTLVTRYHALAASTLEGLNEEEKKSITSRPELDENAFID